jgi:hypothetical protein
MPSTTTFCDIEMTEKVEKYRYENEDYTWEEGDVVSLPQHTANRFVNQWDRAVWAEEPYEIRDEDYDEVVGRVRDSGKNIDEDLEELKGSASKDGVCEVVKSNGEECGREKPCQYHDDE